MRVTGRVRGQLIEHFLAISPPEGAATDAVGLHGFYSGGQPPLLPLPADTDAVASGQSAEDCSVHPEGGYVVGHAASHTRPGGSRNLSSDSHRYTGWI